MRLHVEVMYLELRVSEGGRITWRDAGILRLERVEFIPL